MPAPGAERCLQELQGLGYGRAAVIGRVEPRGAREEQVTIEL